MSSTADKVVAFVSAIASALAPAYELVADVLELDWRPSIYQPGIYGAVPKFFLILPLVIGLYAGWRAVIRSGAITVIFIAFISVVAVVAAAYFLLPSDSPLHQANWVLSYVAISLSCSLAIGVVWSLFRSH